MTNENDNLTEDVLEDEDPRTQLQSRIADSLAELSEAVETPNGFAGNLSPFGVDDINFQTNSWMMRLADVQQWLNFDRDVSLSTPATFLSDLVLALGLDGDDIQDQHSGGHLSERALERLSDRAEIGARLQQAFAAEMDAEGGNRTTASSSWREAWETEDENAQDTSPEPVTAKADVWHIFQLTKKKLNLTPSYQRGDVWRTGDRQALIESILRGIPLPSIILLRTGGTKPHDVVDGKQRLTAILRFVGQHPVAVSKVDEAHTKHPEADFKALFTSDYPTFRKAWKQYFGEPLSAKLEDEYYFPFKLRTDANGGLVGEDLGPLRGKYFTQIRRNTIMVADQEVTVEELFEGAPDYKVPVIEYTKASQKQIHEVFKLYNKQGMHLNAEEIRNAIYHEVELTRAILVAAGDASTRSRIEEIAPSLAGRSNVLDLGKTLRDYGFGDARYRRTKVLAWIIATLLNDPGDKDLPSTARHIDVLLQGIQEQSGHPMRNGTRIAELFDWLSEATDLHASHDELWSDSFKDGGPGTKWQELQLVGSIVGIAMALAGDPHNLESRIEAASERIRTLSASKGWKRPEKTQTRSQWEFIAHISIGLLDEIGIDRATASSTVRSKFGSSGVDALSRLSPPAEVGSA
ncbi:DUF262 domain-containing protein [uncultured Frigoribacterium sp.]|uniref:DUF262 domain-containing protein n=1 Tax=uncultured Frigoribacterium sp. TaxID=335377 RepID=UPI0028D3C669|nr:DUF262 domain-containing protein [uncultured Frigoribacterium sp.]